MRASSVSGKMGTECSSERKGFRVASRLGPASLVQSAAIARRYYLDGRSKVDIAEEFGLNRFKVARMLDHARESGLIRIEIGHPGLVDVELSARLQETFGLTRAVVVDTGDDNAETLRTQVGQFAADVLAEVIGPDDVLGIAWARSVGAMAKTLPRLPGVPVVQLTGAIALPGSGDSSFDIVRDVARAAGGPAYVYYAPIVLPNAAAASALRQQSDIARAFGQVPQVTKAVVGLGLCAPGGSTLYDALSERDHAELRELGVCAEVCGVFLTATGEPVRAELTDRVIAVGAEDLRAMPDVLVVAYGTAKLPAARAALRSGLINGFVTHATFARALLDES
ncbi:MAG: transcriptional regulator [Actinophytocola sp.]|nr:transcriptional regulator [Actinophytocola sp.]